MAKARSPAKEKRDSSSRSGSDTRQRAGIVTFRATAGERAELTLAADRAGLSVGSYVRGRALTVPTTRAVRRPTVERAALSQILAQLGKAGSNLNQIARALNSGGSERGDLNAAIEEFRAACAIVMRAMGKRPPEPAA